MLRVFEKCIIENVGAGVRFEPFETQCFRNFTPKKPWTPQNLDMVGNIACVRAFLKTVSMFGLAFLGWILRFHSKSFIFVQYPCGFTGGTVATN